MNEQKTLKNFEKKCLILDLDNTLYLKQTGLLNAIDHNIDVYMQEKLKIPLEQLSPMRREFCERYGTTLSGLLQSYPIDPKDYFEYAYGVDLQLYLQPDISLQRAFQKLSWRKIVFSNSPADYVWSVLRELGIAQQIEEVYDIVFCDYLAKPRPEAFEKVLDAVGVTAQECIFVDDTPANVIVAEKLGFSVLLADDSRQWLNSLCESAF